ncbi:uncharacterized protein LOC113554681 [Rhopalosiphum maidis]|uniref:uncharacterized protein LOC113554681 n=1 Tax=Rhopalosiphum maidis TaxID=43146 RepID=UPI000EFFF54B|nr:uncharacterized protein LOC113554681 [Rhopalosiphum maidis]
MSPRLSPNKSLFVFSTSTLSSFALLLSFTLQLHLMAAAATRHNAGGLAAALHNEGEKCAQSADLWPCLTRTGAKVVAAVAAYPGEIPLMGQYLAVVPNGRARAFGDHRGADGRLTSHKNGTLSSWPSTSIYSKIAEFAEKRSLRVSVPMDAVAWLIGVTASTPFAGDEGRGKKDKGAGVLMLGGMMMITTLMSTAFGALALMAAKGLLTSILALMLSAMAVSKKSGGHGHARTTYEVINNPGPHQAYQQVSDYKLENSGAVISDISAGQYNAAQTEPIQYGNQQYD